MIEVLKNWWWGQLIGYTFIDKGFLEFEISPVHLNFMPYPISCRFLFLLQKKLLIDFTENPKAKFSKLCCLFLPNSISAHVFLLYILIGN
jgi:hypothetical protein